MGISKQKHEIQPAELNRIAKEATSDSFTKAIRSNITLVYTEGDVLIKRLPDGKKVTLFRLKRGQPTLTSKFKLK